MSGRVWSNLRGRIERQRGHENVCPDIKDDEVVVMSHVVTDKDLVDMRGDFASLKRRLAALQPWDATKAQVSSPKPWEACADTLNFMAEPSIHERLASLKHLGGSYNTGFGSGFYTYSCPVTVYNYTSALNWTPRTLETTVRWNDGDGNLTDALRRIAGSEDQWTISWWDGREGLMFLQANAQDAFRLPSSGKKEK